MDILLVSKQDVCRSRIAQELLNAFGRGMKITTAGVLEGGTVPEAVSTVMQRNGYEISHRKALPVEQFVNRSWDYVISLCEEAEKDLKQISLQTEHTSFFYFEDPFAKNLADADLEQAVDTLYHDMYRKLFELYRDELSEQLLPRCTCGANTYCRCE